MHLTPVESRNIKAIGFDPVTNTLSVQFLGGNTYHYRNVPAEVHQKFLEAESKGRFFHAEIRGKFEYEKIAPQAEEANTADRPGAGQT